LTNCVEEQLDLALNIPSQCVVCDFGRFSVALQRPCADCNTEKVLHKQIID
jgi:hypothetical protein